MKDGNVVSEMDIPYIYEYNGYKYKIESISEATRGDIKGLKKINVSEGIKKIGDFSFDNFVDVTSITIPSTVTTLGKFSLSHAASLRNVILPENLTTIDSYAFNWSGLTSITIPKSVVTIGDYAFSNSQELAKVYIETTNVEFGSRCFESLKFSTSSSSYGSTIYVRNANIRNTLMSNQRTEKRLSLNYVITDYITIQSDTFSVDKDYFTQVSTNYNW
jgi:hypothetical protein